DIAIYFGYVAPLVRSGRVADLALLARLGDVSERVVRLQERMQALFLDWATRSAPRPASGAVDQSRTEFLVRMVHAMREERSDEALRASLADNLATLEQLAVLTFARAAGDLGLDAP